MVTAIYEQLLAANLFEIVGLVSGLICVCLLIRQSIWTWPIGLVYTLVSLVVFFNAKLYSEFGLHIYYAVMNAYGWYYWSRKNPEDSSSSIPITRINRTSVYVLLGIVAVCIPALAELMKQFTDADMAYADATITVLSFAAMWMTARKLIESWLLWLLVDVLATVVYVMKGIELYAVLYGVYIVMAVLGWLSWQKSLDEESLPVSAT